MVSMKHSILLAAAILVTGMGSASAADSKPALPIGIIDLNVLLNDSQAGKSLQDQLKDKRDSFKNEFAKREEELKSDEKNILDNKNDMKPEELAKKKTDFEDKLRETQKLMQTRRASLDKGLSDALQELRKNIIEVAAKIADEKGYAMVISRENVVVVEKEHDITKEALDRLNKDVKTIKLTIK